MSLRPSGIPLGQLTGLPYPNFGKAQIRRGKGRRNAPNEEKRRELSFFPFLSFPFFTSFTGEKLRGYFLQILNFELNTFGPMHLYLAHLAKIITAARKD